MSRLKRFWNSPPRAWKSPSPRGKCEFFSAEQAGFEVRLTTDTNLPQQQNMQGRKLAVVILTKNRWVLIQPRMKEIVAAVNSARPGTYSVVDIPDAERSL